MLIRAHVAVISIFLGVSGVYGQQTPPQPDPSQPVLAPEQQREKQIRTYDPLDPANPLDRSSARSGDAGKTAVPDAQDQSQTNRTVAPRPAVAKPLPGSVAASSQKPVNPHDEGPQVLTDDATEEPVQEYTGPAVLSRSYTVSRPMMPQEVKWRPFVGISGAYDTGLTGAGVITNGTLLNTNAYGALLDWGLSGRHFWKHDQVGVDYHGNYNRYSSASAYNGSNQLLNVDYTHAFSRHLALNLVESGSIYSQSYTLENPALGTEGSIANMNLAASPTVQILDQGLRQFTSMANLTWQKSARLSVNLGGGFFVVDRTGNALFGNTGYQSQADVNYRYTRKLTVGLYYQFTDYTFTKHIQVSNAHTIGGIVSYALNRSMQIRLRAGGTRIENSGLTTVVIPPAIAVLLGQSTGIVESYHLAWLSDISAEVVKDFRRGRTARLSYARGIAPGNGALLTSSQESITGGFTMMLLRHYMVSTGVGRTTLSSVGQAIGRYQTDYVFFGVSRDYGRGFTGNFRFDYRKFNVSDQPLLHDQYRVTLGFSWSPGEGPLKIW